MFDYPIVTVNPESVELAPWNYKRDDNLQAAKLLNAMEKSGYISKIIVAQREEEPESDVFEVIDGNHRVIALREKKIESVQAIFVGRVKKTMRQRIGIELNELKFESDNSKMAEIMTGMVEDFGIDDLVLTMPYNSEDIKTMQGFDEFEPEESSILPADRPPEDREFVSFSFGEYNGKIPQVIYEQFQNCIASLQKSKVENLINQIEYLCVTFLNDQGASLES